MTRTETDSASCLQIEVGQCSLPGIKPDNEDYVGFHVPEDPRKRQSKGAAIAVADGVSTAEAGREASRTAVTQFLSDYFQTPDTWSVSHAGQRILTAINLKLYRKSHEYLTEDKGFLCTFSGVVVKSRVAHLFHAGDSRIYRLRGGNLEQLSRDHKANVGNNQHILARALGMDNSIQIDYGTHDIAVGDLFLVSTDGIHDFVSQDDIRSRLMRDDTPQALAENLVDLALKQGSNDNVSCVVARILGLPWQSLDDYSHTLTRLPFPPPLRPGMKVDGFEVIEELFASSRSQLYLVVEQSTGKRLVMKTPSVNYEDDASYIDRFIQEEWIGKRIESPFVVNVVDQASERTFLYYLMEYVEGESLDSWMRHHPQPRPSEAIRIIDQIADGLKSFHDQETIHQDLKPGNIMITVEGNVKIVDFGSVFVAGIAEMFKPLEHEGALGTATYSDPHYLLGVNSGVQGDIYSLATITYELFTGGLPYGNKIAECHSALDYDRLRYRPASEINPLIPLWFDRTLEKGTAFHLEDRYASLDAFMHDLHHPNPEYLLLDPEYTKDKDKALFWEVISGFWLVTLILVVALFSCQP
ncbi:MAG: bifunctional protein-serine/threonine kinase/phosphatase [Ketobacteraceae bacterium]|nr:bifunctional protein-serine/threonine kinase/phosphatase [Ketobacteraceae bacterium]